MKRFISFLLLMMALIPVSAGNKHYTVIVSLDGCRWDYPKMYSTPFFDQMAEEGVSAVMFPSYPSKTFPNHYTLATGLYPDHHGIIANSFWAEDRQKMYSMTDPDTRNDASFYGGEPIWITAQRQGVKTGNVYWVGSDIAIKGQHPTYFKSYDNTPRLNYAERVAHILRLLKMPEAERPQLVMAYFEDPDHFGHSFSPHSHETRQCLTDLDALMKQLWDGIQSLPFAEDVNLIITSDQGMATVSPDRCVSIAGRLKKEWYERINDNLPAQIYVKKNYVDSVYQALQGLEHVRVWKKTEIPAYLHYGTNPYIGDIIVSPDLGWLVTDNNNFKIGGAHGFDPTYDDMQVMFRAVGPDFKKGYTAKKFHNVSIYSLLARLLHITPAKTDGSIEEVKDMLTE